MKTAIGWTIHALALVAVILAIWSPVGSWWQWAATAVVLIVVGAMILGSPNRYAEGGEIPTSVTYSSKVPVHLRDGETLSSTGDEELDAKLNARPNYGKRRDER